MKYDISGLSTIPNWWFIDVYRILLAHPQYVLNNHWISTQNVDEHQPRIEI